MRVVVFWEWGGYKIVQKLCVIYFKCFLPNGDFPTFKVNLQCYNLVWWVMLVYYYLHHQFTFPFQFSKLFFVITPSKFCMTFVYLLGNIAGIWWTSLSSTTRAPAWEHWPCTPSPQTAPCGRSGDSTTTRARSGSTLKLWSRTPQRW